MNKVLFIIDYSISIGAGHFVRCSKISEEFLTRNFEVICYSSASHLSFPSTTRVSKNIFEENLSIEHFEHDANIVIVDSIRIDYSLIRIIEKRYPYARRVVIDDFRRLSYKDWIVIDWTPSVVQTKKHHHNSKDNTLLLGVDFLPLSNYLGRFRKDGIVVCLGGTDALNLNNQVCKILAQYVEGSRITVVNGQENLMIEHGVKVTKWLDGSDLAELFSKSQLVISGAGQTMYDLVFLGVPFIPLLTHENQVEDLSSAMLLSYNKFSPINVNELNWQKAFVEGLSTFLSNDKLNLSGLARLVDSILLNHENS